MPALANEIPQYFFLIHSSCILLWMWSDRLHGNMQSQELEEILLATRVFGHLLCHLPANTIRGRKNPPKTWVILVYLKRCRGFLKKSILLFESPKNGRTMKKTGIRSDRGPIFWQIYTCLFLFFILTYVVFFFSFCFRFYSKSCIFFLCFLQKVNGTLSAAMLGLVNVI